MSASTVDARSALDSSAAPSGRGTDSRDGAVRGDYQSLIVALGFVLAALSLVRWASYLSARSGPALVLFVAGWWHLATAIVVLRRPSLRAIAAVAVSSSALVAGWVLLHVVSPAAQTSISATVWVMLEAVNAAVGAWVVRCSQRSGQLSARSLPAVLLTVVVLAVGVFAVVQDDGVAISSGDDAASQVVPVTTTSVVTTVPVAAVESVLDPMVRAELGDQLTVAREAAMRYPTVADAKAAGMIGGTGSVPGTGVHFQFPGAESLRSIRPDGTLDPAQPGSWMYDGTADDAPVVGVMYNVLTPDPPTGFVSDRDAWHQHENVCTKVEDGDLILPLDGRTDATEADCDAVGGVFAERSSWMLHAWVVPGWESPEGVFSHSNPTIHCPDSTDRTDPSGICIAP